MHSAEYRNYQHYILLMYIKDMSKSIEKDWNRHHLLYTRRFYRTPIQRELRSNPTLIWQLDKAVHSELHARIPAVRPPDDPILAHITDRIKGFNKRIETASSVILILDNLASSERLAAKRADSCKRFADFLYQQLTFLTS